MTDITKCSNGCDHQGKCYRWTAASSNYQSFADFKPDADGKCEHFYSNGNKRRMNSGK